MRQRADASAEAQKPAASLPSAAEAARAASKRLKTKQSKVRGFWIATGCFALCLVLYVCFGGPALFSSSSFSKSSPARRGFSGPRVAERDIVALGLATQQVSDQLTLPALNELTRSAAQIGAVYLTLLEHVVDAQERDDGHALRQLDVSQHYLASVAKAIQEAADVSYAKLKAMLLQEPGAGLAKAPSSLMRTTYGWLLSDLFLYSAVLPEYYLLQDDTSMHARVLLRSLNLLSWAPLVYTVPSEESVLEAATSGMSLPTYDLFNWSGGAACRKGPLGPLSKKWTHFCETSFSSWPAVARREAATYEELIVLYPDYAPLRLHYAIAFVFLSWPGSSTDAAVPSLTDHAMKALRVLRNDREKLGVRYKSADAVHAPLLVLLEAFLTPVELWTSEQNAQLVQALGALQDCQHVYASLLRPGQWEGDVFAGEYRTALLTPSQLSALLAKAQVHLGPDHEALKGFHECY